MDKCDVAIVGAGPYGLSAAAHLRRVKGLDARLIGEPMSFWERHMPEGMNLRSPWAGSHLSHPDRRFTLDEYRGLEGNHHLGDPLPVRDFIRYGHWFRREQNLSPDERRIMQITRVPGGYQLTFDRGEALNARRVVMAAGIQPFAFRPRIFRNLPVSLATHTSEQRDFEKFRGKTVLVVGGGQSAMEAAIFLYEAGARVELMIRGLALYWLDHRRWLRAKPFVWMLYGAGEIGPAGASLVIQRPNLFRRLPRRFQAWGTSRAMRPAVAQWLRERSKEIPIRTERFAVQVRIRGMKLHVRLNDGAERVVDHVILGTGYRINVGRYPFLRRDILERLDLVDGLPRLDAGFESSLPGLHFLGAPSAWSFGPLMRFVAGTGFAASQLARRIVEARKTQPARDPQLPELQVGAIDLDAKACEAKTPSISIP